MDQANTPQTILESPKTARPSWTRLRLYGLQVKLILPYVILTLLLASVGIFIITALVVDSNRERLDNSLLDASLVANDAIVQVERQQLERLRFLIFQDGMAQAMYDHDAQAIKARMEPIFASGEVDIMTALDQEGREILTYGQDFSTSVYHEQQGVDFSAVSIVRKVLDGVEDEKGDKFVEILMLKQGPILFTSSPVEDANGQQVGVMLVGTYLERILQEIKGQALADIVVVSPGGQVVSATLAGNEEGYGDLARYAQGLDPNGETQVQEITLNRRMHRLAYSPLYIREQQAGWIGVIKDGEYLVSQAGQSRNLLILIFSVGTLAMILIGYFLAQNIAEPLLRLRTISQAVAAGDLNQKTGITRADEIGELSAAFDTMTEHLRERTEEAQRLYAETLQRNKELAEINARLEATQLQLIQSEKLASIGQLTAGIVHDVKNPFAVIMGMAEVLAEDENLSEETAHGLKVIRESAVKGNNIVSDLLKFARQTQPEMREQDLRETVQTALRLTAYLTRRYQLTCEIPEAPLLVHYDAQQVEQVIINMIHNAVQAMPDGGALGISLKQENGAARITIQDSGCGIKPEHLKRIFDPFFTTKSEGEGTGLGLSVSYGIIANHGGRIEVESEFGQGTRFTIILPAGQPS